MPQSRQPHRCEVRLSRRVGEIADQTCLAHQLVALEHLLLVPGSAVAPKRHAQPLTAIERTIDRTDPGILLGPSLQSRLDAVGKTGRATAPPILPGQKIVPALPGRTILA